MQIYPKAESTQISYSPQKSSSRKKYMAGLKRGFICDKIIGKRDSQNIIESLSLNKDRTNELLLQSNGVFIPDMYFNQKIFTRTNLSFISNQRSFYVVKEKRYFKICSDMLPLTYTKQCTTFPGKFYFRFITVTVYKKKFKVKLGFFGTHLKEMTHHIRSIQYGKNY